MKPASARPARYQPAPLRIRKAPCYTRPEASISWSAATRTAPITAVRRRESKSRPVLTRWCPTLPPSPAPTAPATSISPGPGTATIPAARPASRRWATAVPTVPEMIPRMTVPPARLFFPVMPCQQDLSGGRLWKLIPQEHKQVCRIITTTATV